MSTPNSFARPSPPSPSPNLSSSLTMSVHSDEMRDKVPDDLRGVPPSRAHSPGSPRMTKRPPLDRSTTTDTQASRLSRVASTLPNPERQLAEKQGGPPQLSKFSYGLFDPEMAVFRGIAIKILMGMVVMVTLVMWLAVPFYFGSLWKANHYTDKLTVRIIDRAGDAFGQAITQGLLENRKYMGLGYFVTSPSEFPTDADVYHNILEEGAWGAVIISEAATTNLATARAIGNSSYDGRQAVQFVYSQARNELATGTYLIPLATAHLQAIMGKLNAQSVAQFLPTIAGNASALAAVAQAPSTLSAPFGVTNVNLRAYDQPVASAITLVGLIYVLIFSFVTTMANNGVREIISPYLTTKAYLTYRLVAPFCVYFPISFSFAMIALPFKVKFDAHFTYAGGFFAWWFLLFLAMGALGLTTEFIITIIGPKFVPFFLVPFIIANVSVAALPHELQPWIYRYGVAMPFYNANRAVRTLIFNTKNDLGRNYGILLAWIGFSMFTVTFATWAYRRKAVNEHNKAMGENEKDRTLPDGRVV